jgi:RNA polymerase primary sigma factor
VIKMRFGLGHGSEHTLEEVGQSLAVTRERIRDAGPPRWGGRD